MNRIVQIYLLLVLLLLALPTRAQEDARWGISTNGLLWLTGSPNIGGEFAASTHSSIAGSVSYNPFTFGTDHKMKHLLGLVEYRYWLSHSYSGHFFGVHAQGGMFNIGGLPLSDDLRDHRYEGQLYGGGFTYGYHWNITKRFNIGAEIGVGYLRLNYTKYECTVCGREVDRYRTNYLGPTKLAVSLVYLIK